MSEHTLIPYSGSELELFADARVWRTYWQEQIGGFIGKRVLEVGAGLGTVVRSLPDHGVEHWVALEPDPTMASRLATLARSGALPVFCEPRPGTTAALDPAERFDTIMYVDVLEHIENDRAELLRAAQHLAPNGTLIVLAPAHQWLFSAFDAAIGHFRRYNRGGLVSLGAPNLRVVRARYLDTVGLAASLANRALLKQSAPSPGQIRTWDRVMVRLSRVLDPVLGYRFGKTVLVVWRRS